MFCAARRLYDDTGAFAKPVTGYNGVASDNGVARNIADDVAIATDNGVT